MTPHELEQRISALQQQYTREENELLRLRPRAKHLKQTLAQLDGAIAVLRGLLQTDQQAQEAVPTPNGTAPELVPSQG
jgi:phage shock protein A